MALNRKTARTWLLGIALALVFACGGKPEVEFEKKSTGVAGATSKGGTGNIDADGGIIQVATGGSGAVAGNATTQGAYCGDGVADANEQCDDANNSDGDGCSASCQREPNATCPPTGGRCQVCGNSVAESAEGCDDGNTTAGDGCSSTCALEGKYVCDVPGKACHDCGNGVREGTEICDDGNNLDDDGCSKDCKLIATGYNCPPTGGACSLCGNGARDANEECDDGNRYSLDGCLFNCKAIEEGYTCPATGGTCQKCGDGRTTGTEQCDDRNAADGDGCSSACMVEAGHICVAAGFFSYCYACGNGVQEGATTGDHESCDDSNAQPGDGCSASCQVETDAAWVCPLPGEHCLACGNGKLEGTDQDLLREECDDGNSLGGDGCSALCQLEIAATCPTPGQPCVLCGDGDVSAAAGEQCDDGNRFDRDGCSSKCQREAGWNCPEPDPTTLKGVQCNICGNGRVEVGTVEQCDDGNTNAGDGCGNTCLVEQGWECQLYAGTVRSLCDTCGNGVRRFSEGCDDGKDCGDANKTRCFTNADCAPVNGTCLTRSNDGCSNACAREEGFTCPEPGGYPCNSCGNGVREGTEVCDAGQYNGTGCINSCMGLDVGWACPVAGQPCEQCGNGTKDAHELCDDGDLIDTNGCSADCQTITPGWLCPVGLSCTLCGNSRLDSAAGEECDDGTAQGGDGCANCREEAGWDCFASSNSDTLSRSICEPCGNGVVRGTEEACDDGNRSDGDGCSQTCQVQSTAWYCPETGGQCRNCGDGKIQRAGGEVCDTGTADSAGCNSCTAILPNWYCLSAGKACFHCGDRIVTPPEVCDDGEATPDNGDGCRRDCQQIEQGWICPNNAGIGGPCTLCGNGVKDSGEGCDDRNTISGDGCSAICVFEGAPFDCSVEGRACTKCGNARVEVGEVCDDGNAADGDGCQANCKAFTSTAWSCAIPGVACNNCGDKTLQGVEQCDDGKMCTGTSTACNADAECGGVVGSCKDRAGDGCSKCTLDLGWTCEGTTCAAVRCGDGYVAGVEQCDDRNTLSGDGCSSRCTIETDWRCPPAGGACVKNSCGDNIIGGTEQCDGTSVPVGKTCNNTTCKLVTSCGDGFVGGDEQCDDGRAAANNDGCSTLCKWEQGWICTGNPGTYNCNNTGNSCGDGIRSNYEACDDGPPAASGDGCSATCQVETFFICTDTLSAKSTCSPQFRWVVVRPFRLTSIDPETILFDPNTRSFVGYKGNNAGVPLELCLDGTMIVHPTASSTGMISVPTTVADVYDERVLTTQSGGDPSLLYWAPSKTRVPLLNGSVQLTGSTYDPYSGTWYLVAPGTGAIYQFGSLPTLTNPPAPIGSILISNYSALTSITGFAIGDDRRAYVTIQEGGSNPFLGIRAFGTGTALGFNFDSVQNFWTVSSTTSSNSLDGIVPLAGFGAVAVFNDADGDARTDLRAFKTSETDALLGVSRIPGTLVSNTDVYGLAISIPVGTPLLDKPGDGMESTTDGSGFIMCTKAASGSCYLFAQTCKTDADCVSGATCQKTYVNAKGETVSYVVPFCAAVGVARDDFATTSLGANVPINVLANDTRSTGTCRDATFALESTSATLYDGIAKIETTAAACAPSLAPCIVYQPPADGTCNVIDQFTYKVKLGAGTAIGAVQVDEATVRVTVTCSCGNGTVEPTKGEECDPPATASPEEKATCSANCTYIAVCGNNRVEGTETCDKGARCDNGTLCTNVGGTCPSGGTCRTRDLIDCSWDCRIQGCGNKTIDGAEQCDDGNNVDGDGCRANCTTERCNDGILDPGEQCDDGNQTESDGCLKTCVIGPVCGNGVVEGTEQCDGGSSPDPLKCRTDCTRPLCGDGIPDAGEECDDGDNVDGLNCSWNCLLPICGNGRLDYGEFCDNGKQCGDAMTVCVLDADCATAGGTCLVRSGDGCSNTCTLEGCGNNQVEGLEQCDKGPTGDATCRSNCTRIECGDFIQDAGEACDNGKQCDDGKTLCTSNADCGAGGTCAARSGDGCSATCQSEGYCGDGVVMTGVEECDYLNDSTCNYLCQKSGCGNGYVEAGEQCDDGNSVETDGCRSDCKSPICGDKVIDSYRGEQCDDGPDNGKTATSCTIYCLLPGYCGNGKVDPGEQCDGTPGCAGCLFAGCGNGKLESGEICDPTAPDKILSCRSDCTQMVCGDGMLDPTEQCDDNNNVSGDGCSELCVLETACGDGRREGPEQCDDGNSSNGDGCSSVCRWEYCGNGVRDVDASGAFVEACDDGNNASGDGCSSTCTDEAVCGDGVTEAPEQCDDGNSVVGDGCSPDCREEAYCGNKKVDAGEECDYSVPGETNCSTNCTTYSILL